MPAHKNYKSSRKYSSAEIVEKYREYRCSVDEYNNSGEHPDRLYPTIEGFRAYIGIAPNTWDEYANPTITDPPDDISDTLRKRYEDDNLDKMRTADIIKKISDELLNGLIQLALNNPKTAAMAIYLSKQKAYGGYTDKQQIDTNSDVSITFKLLDSKGKPI